MLSSDPRSCTTGTLEHPSRRHQRLIPPRPRPTIPSIPPEFQISPLIPDLRGRLHTPSCRFTGHRSTGAARTPPSNPVLPHIRFSPSSAAGTPSPSVSVAPSRTSALYLNTPDTGVNDDHDPAPAICSRIAYPVRRHQLVWLMKSNAGRPPPSSGPFRKTERAIGPVRHHKRLGILIFTYLMYVTFVAILWPADLTAGTSRSAAVGTHGHPVIRMQAPQICRLHILQCPHGGFPALRFRSMRPPMISRT